MPPLRATSPVARALGAEGYRFLVHTLSSIERLLPHIETTKWEDEKVPNRAADPKPLARWTSTQHKAIELRVVIGGINRLLTATVSRRRIPRLVGNVERTLDQRELGICKLVVDRVTKVLRRQNGEQLDPDAAVSLGAIMASFDEEILAGHVRLHHGLALSMSEILRAMHQLSEVTYENSALAFGCVITPRTGGSGLAADFLRALVRSKKYRALSDGFRTAYEISSDGTLLRFLSLEKAYSAQKGGRHYSPEWTEWMAAAATKKRVALCLTRNGDILLFANGSMTFAYRYGQWKFWNHAHLINLLTTLARVQKVSPKIVGRVVSAIYRASLDVAFRRTGALFLVLRSKRNLRLVAKHEDQVQNPKRDELDLALDQATVVGRNIQSIPREILAEIASLDGAVVTSNQGQILAYGAVLRPRKQGKLKGTEGSRTKAAIGASHYGLAIKVSSDGDITVYAAGEEFLKI